MKTVVIEISGGVLQRVYADDAATRVVVVDWDLAECEPAEPVAGRFPVDPLGTLTDETRAELVGVK